MEEELQKTAKWEYNCLVSDMAQQGEEWSYPGGWEAWYEEVFLRDDAWVEIRSDVINQFTSEDDNE